MVRLCAFYGLVVHSQILAVNDENGRRRAFVDFSLPEEAACAKFYLDGSTMWGSYPLDVSYARKQLSDKVVCRNHRAAQPMTHSLESMGTNHDGGLGVEEMLPAAPRQPSDLLRESVGSAPAPLPVPALPPGTTNNIKGLVPTSSSTMRNGGLHDRRTPNLMRTAQGPSSSFGSSQSEWYSARDTLDLARHQSYSSGSAVTTPSDEQPNTNSVAQPHPQAQALLTTKTTTTSTNGNPTFKQIIVLGLPKNMTDRHLRLLGSIYGKVHQAIWVEDPSLVGTKYAVLEFATASQASRATEELDGRKVGATWPGSTHVEGRTYVLVPPDWRSAALDRCTKPTVAKQESSPQGTMNPDAHHQPQHQRSELLFESAAQSYARATSGQERNSTTVAMVGTPQEDPTFYPTSHQYLATGAPVSSSGVHQHHSTHQVPSISAQESHRVHFTSSARSFLAPSSNPSIGTVRSRTDPWEENWFTEVGSNHTQGRATWEDDWSLFYPGTISPTSTARPTNNNSSYNMELACQVTNTAWMGINNLDQGSHDDGNPNSNHRPYQHSLQNSSLTSTIVPSATTTLTNLHSSSFATLPLGNVHEPRNRLSYLGGQLIGPETECAFNRAPGSHIPTRGSVQVSTSSNLQVDEMDPVPPLFSNMLSESSSSATPWTVGADADDPTSSSDSMELTDCVVPFAPWPFN